MVVVVVEEKVDGDICLIVGRSKCELQVTLGWEDCCGGEMEKDQPAFISERRHPATGTSVEPNSDDHFPFATEAPPFRHPHDLNFPIFFFVISDFHNK